MDRAADLDQHIGDRIRRLRSGQGLSLDDLAARSGVSRAMLSRIERGESSPTAQLLNRVCGGLGVTLSRLFAAAERTPSPLNRRADQVVWRDPASGYVRYAVSPPGTGSATDVIEVQFPAGAMVAFEAQHLTGADQHIFVLAGRVEITIGDACHRVDAGDCLHMRFGEPVMFRNLGSKPARYLVVITQCAARP
jgi:transcriptional regulator with XRE-family HTH domain